MQEIEPIWRSKVVSIERAHTIRVLRLKREIDEAIAESFYLPPEFMRELRG